MSELAATPTLRRRWLTWRRLGALLLVAAVLLVAPQLRSGTELVRARNALSLGPDLDAGADWHPPQWPATFKRETVPVDPYFAQLASRLGLPGMSDDWQRAVAISAHLLGGAHKLTGGAIQSDLRTTHQRIVQEGQGYCGDFVRVFTAMANAAGMDVRPWAFAFDGFGGHGHIWVEVWNRQRQAWQLVDVFQNYWFERGDGVPLSALQVRQALLASDPALRLRPLHAAAPPGWAIESKAWDYLRRGLPQWYAPWGHNVMSVDASATVRAVAGVSRTMEGLAAIATGLQPRVRLLATAGNAAARDALRSLRLRLELAGVLLAAGLVLLLVPRTARTRPVPAAGWSGAGPRVCVVGPLPPPSGGMANQCEQLLRLLRADGVPVTLVRTNAPYWPAFVGRVPMVRAGARLLPFLGRLWREAGRSDVVHLLANSGWAWHLVAAPALAIGRLRGVPVIVNYRGGLADEFLSRAPRHVHGSLGAAAMRVTPSDYLRRVFAKHGLDAQVIPNVVDLDRFRPHAPRAFGDAPHILVARNLEPIYGLDTAIRALQRVRERYPAATLTLAGSGPQRAELQQLAAALGLQDAVRFPGRTAHAEMPTLYEQTDVALNPSTVDNMPNSVLEAYASQVPLVSTHVGGVPDIVDEGVTGLLVPPGDPDLMAAAVLRVLCDPALAARLVDGGRLRVAAYAWPRVRQQWLAAYRRAAGAADPHAAGVRA